MVFLPNHVDENRMEKLYAEEKKLKNESGHLHF